MLARTSIARQRPDLLPISYVEAKNKLAVCQRIDECKTWADKALALQSYAKQAKDDSLLTLASKIRYRALQRGGQLLAEVKRERGKRTDKPEAGGGTRFEEAVKDAGLSERQAKTMLRIASVPPAQFDALVEREKPPTVERLADLGTKKAERVKPEPYRNEWIDWTNAVRHVSALPACGLDVLAARDPYEVERLRDECGAAIANLKLWLRTLEKQHGR